ncbi:biopolymer transporter ExbD [Chitinophaga caeni]|uniref:Biopolymer transporter ExbD n=2 Tax=Chitinophaga caeni TaxID=2029983 RepID=A0A291QQX8_9BACT|nr:biopolymer transporter ExbD [Chitinophaga caeni]
MEQRWVSFPSLEFKSVFQPKTLAMAEINQHPSLDGNSKNRSKKHSTRVDMTPMVDLGFLLITFFMLTAMLAKPRTMNLVMPADGPPMPISSSKSLTVILADQHKVYYYEGENIEQIQETNFSPAKGIGEVLRWKKKLVADKYGDASSLMVIIKPTDQSVYKDYIDIMDEISINDIRKYATVKIDSIEIALLQNK